MITFPFAKHMSGTPKRTIFNKVKRTKLQIYKYMEFIMKNLIVIIGGGASGLVAAIAAARNGSNVCIIEKNNRLGKKILATGNGKCNITNEQMNCSYYRSDDMTLVDSVLKQFSTSHTKEFFQELGLLLMDKNGYIYPNSGQAATVLDALLMEVSHLNINVILEANVVDISKKGNGFSISYVKEDKKHTIQGTKVILSTGSKAAPKSGSDGSGYVFGKRFHHTIIPPVPALVQLKGEGNYFKHWSGVRLQGSISIISNKKQLSYCVGELQLTDYGISGIPVFQVSRYVSKALEENKLANITAVLDFLPDIQYSELVSLFETYASSNYYKTIEEILNGMIHKKLSPIILKRGNISTSITGKQLSVSQIKQISSLLKQFSVKIIGTNSFEQAQVCAGGISTKEVDSNLQSKKVKGLYIVGELLDVDGMCGGYNLQWAWATGYLAGISASRNN